MNRLFPVRLLFTAIWLCFVAFCEAATPLPASAKRLQPARWLLILDTSSAMEKRAKAAEGVVSDLLGSAMSGKMQAGDELGIWTYNKELYAGVAPMQTWQPARSNLITSRTIEFLGLQVYRDRSRIEKVLPELSRVAAESRELTVVWFSDGTQKFAGTPFDDELNAATAKLKAALDNSRMPVVTVLRAYHGKWVGQSVSVAPWPIEFAAFPAELANTNAPTKSVVAAPKPAPMAKPIIITSPKKTNAEPVTPMELQSASAQLRPLPRETIETPTATAVVPEASPHATPAPVVVTAAGQASVAPVDVPPLPAIESKPVAPVVKLAPESSAPVSTPPLASNIAAKTEPPKPAVQAVAPPVVAATAPLESPAPSSHPWPLIVGAGFMSAAALVALLLAFRGRRPQTVSLITQSLERGQK
ncbi:MAG: hypothetical protein RLY20_231 [Verrucomicrobiota bacterium]|jgi:hypothetical protein